MSNTVPFTTTLHGRDNCLCLAAQRAARALGRRFDRSLRPVDLTNGQFSILMSLNRPQPPSITSVASLLAMDRTTLTANLKPLERRQLLESIVDPSDRRGRLLGLTPAGHALLVEATVIWEAAHGEIDRELGEAQAKSLRAGLRALA